MDCHEGGTCVSAHGTTSSRAVKDTVATAARRTCVVQDASPSAHAGAQGATFTATGALPAAIPTAATTSSKPHTPRAVSATQPAPHAPHATHHHAHTVHTNRPIVTHIIQAGTQVAIAIVEET